jgi:hypothetical protein
MPYVMRKIKNENLYTVKNKETKKVHAKGTTKDTAKAMIRILNAGTPHHPRSQAELRGETPRAPRPQAELEGLDDVHETIWRMICKRGLPL